MSELAVVGRVTIDTIVAADDRLHDRLLGGGLVYSAAGAQIWLDPVSLIGRFSRSLSPAPDKILSQNGFDCSCLRMVDEEMPHDVLFAYEAGPTKTGGHPVRHFSRVQERLPKRFLPRSQRDHPRPDPSSLDPRVEDLPQRGDQPTAAHFASTGWRCAALLGSQLKERGVRFLTYDPSSQEMSSLNKDDLKLVLAQVDVFLPSAGQSREFFRPHPMQVPAMAEAFSAMGPEIVVIKLGKNGALVFNSRSGAHWRVPAYPARIVDITGVGHSFCGGYLAGFLTSEDPLEAALHGSVSASLAIEGPGYGFAAQAHPALKQARLTALRERCWRS
jgi:ribokinase